MLVKIFGGFDLIIGVILIFNLFEKINPKIIAGIGLLLLIKSSLGILKDFASWIDLSAGGILIISIFLSIPEIISIILGILMVQKGIFSFV